MIEDVALVVVGIGVVLLGYALVRALSAIGDSNAQLVASVRSDSQRAIDDQSHAAEAATLRAALAQETARADALQEYISHDAHDTSPTSNLAPDDVAGRVLRLSQRWAAALPGDGTGGHPGGDAAVRDPGATSAPGTHVPGK